MAKKKINSSANSGSVKNTKKTKNKSDTLVQSNRKVKNEKVVSKGKSFEFNEKKDISKSKKVIRKSYADESKITISDDVKRIFFTTLGVLVVLIVFYLISVAVTGGFAKDEKTEIETVEFQYSEILAGTSFDRGGNYIVVYYDKTDSENENTALITNSIASLKSRISTADYGVYTCDLGNAFNEHFVTDGEPNTNPTSVSELSFNGATVIRFENGNVADYVYGASEVCNYLDGYMQ